MVNPPPLGMRVLTIGAAAAGTRVGKVLVAVGEGVAVAVGVFVIVDVLVAVGSGVPALFIIGGALWSAWRVLRRQNPAASKNITRTVISPKRLAIGNVLIAVGTLVLSASGSLAGRLGQDRAFAVTLLCGVSILFSGFLVASNSTLNASSAIKRLHPELLRAVTQ